MPSLHFKKKTRLYCTLKKLFFAKKDKKNNYMGSPFGTPLYTMLTQSQNCPMARNKIISGLLQNFKP